MQPDEHGLKIELIEAGGSDMDWLELEMETTPQTINSFLDMQRESGDGDSGAECKEPTEDGKDFLEIKDALTTITREVQGAERPKDHKKLSRIPVRQTRAPYGQTRPSHDKNTSPRDDTSRDKNQTASNFDSQDENQTIESCNFPPANMKMDEKWREIKQLVEDEEYSLLEAYVEQDFNSKPKIKESGEEENLNEENIAFELGDIYRDLATIPATMNQESVESSLSPRAPLANAEETTSDDFTIDEVDETILEAPEEFRSDAICEFAEMSGLDVSDATWCPSGEEIELSSAHRAEQSRASCAENAGEEASRDRGQPTPEVGAAPCRDHNELDRDGSIVGTGRGNEMSADRNIGRISMIEEENTAMVATTAIVGTESTDNGEAITAVVEVPVLAGGSSDSGSREPAMRLSDGLALPLAIAVATADTAARTKHVESDTAPVLDAGSGADIRDAMNERDNGNGSGSGSEAVSSVAWRVQGQGEAGRVRAARPCDAQRTLAVAAVAAVQASIASGDAVGAPAARCSRVSAVTVRATPRISSPPHYDHDHEDAADGDSVDDGSAGAKPRGLDWEFRDGRLVFTSCRNESERDRDASDRTSSRLNSSDKTVPKQSDSDARHPTLFDVLDTCTQRIEHEIAKSNANANADVDETDNAAEPLRSRDINRRSADSGSRLKLLETKLKEAAGISVSDNNNKSPPVVCKWNVSEKEQVVDKSVVTAAEAQGGIVLDKNDNECKSTTSDVERARQRLHADVRDSDEDCGDGDFPQIEITELGSPADLDAFLDDRFGGRCEFDVKRIGAFSGFGADSEFYLVYDELEDGYSSSCDEEACAGVVSGQAEPEPEPASESSSCSSAMRGDGGGGGGEGEAAPRKRHNPDHDNLKSLLKKPGRGKEKKNRVSFNENRNEFFDADYIILIREDCDYDEDDDDGVCTCNQHEMVRLTCCEPGCGCGYDDVQTQSATPTPQSPKFAPPLEFVDSVTLSPPEGYKDMDLGEQQLLALQLARHRQQQHPQPQQQNPQQQQQPQHPPVCRECSGVHDSDSNSGSDLEEPQYIEKPQDCISSDEYQQSQNAGDQSLEEKEKTDQSQQTTPTTPPADCASVQSRYIMETITMTTVTERRMVREVEETSPVTAGAVEPAPSPSPSLQSGGGGSPISGILKGGKLWKQAQLQQQQQQERLGEPIVMKGSDNMQVSDSSNITSDEEGNTLTRRSVRFHEHESDKRDSCDGEADKGLSPEETDKKTEEVIITQDDDNQNQKETDSCNNSVSPDATEMMLTFKLGHHVLISNNSLRPNSAVRQLFPCSKQVGKTEEDGSVQQYLVTAESLRAFEEAKRSKLPHIMDGDDTIRRTIERNTLRRSLIRYEPRSKKQQQKTDNSLVERIKQLTCDVDDPPPEEEIPPRGSPPGEESAKPMDTINQLNNRNQDKSFSPSSSSTSSSNSSMSSTYKKITDLFGKREKTAAASDAQNNAINESNTKQNLLQTAPDLGNGGTEFIEPQQCAVSKVNATSEARKQFLSTLAPLTACVSGSAAVDEYQYQYQLANNPGERASVASTAGTEYSLEDIDEALKNDAEDSKKVAPDVLVGTPSASESTDELAMFVQQDASRIERIKKRYQPENTTEEDDEHDDYGFNRRPSVRGIKPRFGSTTEILQQIQSQLQPPSNPQPTTQQRQQPNHVWPYYSETGLDNPKTRACPQGYTLQQYPYPEDMKSRTIGQQYRPTSLIEENLYQNCPNQRCTQLHYGPTVNHVHTPVMRIGGGCSDFYQTLPARTRTRPESPPPMELSRSYHQTMVLIPYSRIEGFQSGNVSPNPLYASPDQCNYARFANQKIPPNMANKRYPEPVYTHGTLPGRIGHPPHMDDPQYQLKLGQKQMIRVPYSSGQPVQVHLMASRSESPLPGQFATARATQTPSATLSTCNYYNPGPPNTRYRPAIGPVNAVPHNGTMWHSENPYGSKINRHSFPAGGPRYPMPDNISVADSDSQHSTQLPNGYRQPPMETSFPATRESSAPGSPTKTRFTERGVPEGAASVSPQDSTATAHNSSTMTSPTSPQNPPAQGANGKSLYYAMNV